VDKEIGDGGGAVTRFNASAMLFNHARSLSDTELQEQRKSKNGELMEVIKLPGSTCHLHCFCICFKWWPKCCEFLIPKHLHAYQTSFFYSFECEI